MSKTIRLAEDTISAEELEDLAQWIVAGNQLTKGPTTLSFERKFAEYLGTKHAIYVNSGSSANLLMASALIESGRLKNRIAIVPAVSWVTTVAPFMQLGFETHLCDCDSSNLGLDISHFKHLVQTYRPSIACVVHVLGHANHMDEIKSICEEYDVLLIEDSCEALGTSLNGKLLGTLSTAGSFSFYYGHHISTIEGGLVCTNDTELHNLMLSIRSHGWSRDVDPEFRTMLTEKHAIDAFRNLYTFYYPGYNLRATDLQASIGLAQLDKLDTICQKREANYCRYKHRLSDFFSQNSDAEFVSSFAYGTLVSNRMETYEYLSSCGIESRPLICGNIGRHPFWIKAYGNLSLKNADLIHDYGMYLPNHANMTLEDVDYVCDKFLHTAQPLRHPE